MFLSLDVRWSFHHTGQGPPSVRVNYSRTVYLLRECLDD